MTDCQQPPSSLSTPTLYFTTKDAYLAAYLWGIRGWEILWVDLERLQVAFPVEAVADAEEYIAGIQIDAHLFADAHLRFAVEMTAARDFGYGGQVGGNA